MTRRFVSLSLCATLGILSFAGCHSGSVAQRDPIQMRFDHLDRVLPMQFARRDVPDRDAAHIFSKAYNGQFSHFQTPDTLRKLDEHDVVLLFRAAFDAQFYTADPTYIEHMQLDLNELEKRGHASQWQYDDLYDALIGNRMFSRARAIERTHPSPKMGNVPAFRDLTVGHQAGPTELLLSADGQKLVRRRVDLDKAALIVVIVSPLCHFAQFGLRDVEADAALHRAFSSRTIWLVPPDDASTPFDAVAQWNRRHPREVMTLAYNEQEWPMLDRWELPTFYFFRDGKLIREVVGWLPSESKPKIRAALKQIGLL